MSGSSEYTGLTCTLAGAIAALLLTLTAAAASSPSSCMAKLQSLAITNDDRGVSNGFPQGFCDVKRLLRPCSKPASSRRIADHHVSRQCLAVLEKSRISHEVLQRVTDTAYNLGEDVFRVWCSRADEGDVAFPGASNPVVIDRGGNAAPFALCSVPKAGCTRLRSLLHLLTEKSTEAVSFDRMTPHYLAYPNLWHYDAELVGALGESNEAYGIPKILVGRDPYARVLSGFLNKLTLHENVPQDVHTLKHVYWILDRSPTEPFSPDLEGFRAFLRMLVATKGRDMNEHFKTAVNDCHAGLSSTGDLVAYDYAFKLEQMSHWLPCLSDFLGLNHYVWSGWKRGSNNTIEYSDRSESGCWFRPGQYTCEEYEQLVRGSMLEMALPGPFEEDLSSQKDADRHSTNAWSHIAEFFDEETERLVYDYYRPDFELFGYERMTFDHELTTVS